MQKIGQTDLAIVTFKSRNYYLTASLGSYETINIGDKLYVSGFPKKEKSLSERT